MLASYVRRAYHKRGRAVHYHELALTLVVSRLKAGEISSRAMRKQQAWDEVLSGLNCRDLRRCAHQAALATLHFSAPKQWSVAGSIKVMAQMIEQLK